MEFFFKIDGLDRIQHVNIRVQREITKEIKKGLLASAVKVEGQAKRSVAGGAKTGLIYRQGAVSHRASAPGEAPANDTGRLLNSITAYLENTSAPEAFIVAGRGIAKYASALEFGTAKMAARPFMFPAVEKSRDWIKDRLTQAVINGILKATKK